MLSKAGGAAGISALLTVLGAASPVAKAQGVWRGIPLASPRRDHTATLISGQRVVLVGGSTCRGDDRLGSSSAEVLDLAEMKTRPLPELKVVRKEHTASLMRDGRLVVAGGNIPPSHAGPTGATDSVEILTNKNGSWRWEEGPRLLHARRAHGAVVIRDGRLVVVGGYDSRDVPLSSVEIWDPKRTAWQEGPSLREPGPGARAHVLRDGRVLVLTNLNHAEVWDPSSARPWRVVKAPGIQEPLGRALTTIELPDGRILVAGPKVGETYLRASVLTWNPKSEAWSVVASLEDTGKQFGNPPWATAAALGRDVAFFGQQTAQSLSPKTGDWRQLEPPLLRFYGAAVTSLRDGKLLVTGGHDGRCDLAEVWYPAESALGRWTRTTNRQEPLVVLSTGQVLTISPPDPFNPLRPRQTTLWDPKTGKVGEPAVMRESRSRFAATRLPDDRVLVAGGVNDGRAVGDTMVRSKRADVLDPVMLGSVEIFSPQTNRWTAAPSLNEARESHHAVSGSSGRVLVLGGTYSIIGCHPFDGGYHCRSRGGFERTSDEAWSPGARSWQITSRTSQLQVGASITLLEDGRVLAVGGEPDGTRAAVLDSKSGKWTTTAAMTHARANAAVTTLADGRVLVAGGVWAEGGRPSLGVTGRTLSTAEVWSSKTEKWTPTSSLSVGAFQARALRLPDGRVIVSGLVGQQVQRPTRPEVWDPRADQWTPTVAKPEDEGPCPPLLLTTGEVLSCSYTWSAN